MRAIEAHSEFTKAVRVYLVSATTSKEEVAKSNRVLCSLLPSIKDFIDVFDIDP